MCGRYKFSPELAIDELGEITKITDQKYQSKNVDCNTGEIFPTNTVPVLAYQGGKIEPFLMKWGFPKWNSKGVVINARSETAAEKKMFAVALQRRRCVVPANGFFEWQKRDSSKSKDKFYFTSDELPVLYMAGLYAIFQEGDEKKAAFVILTKEANASMSDIHDRMPVILSKSEIKPWLTDPSFVTQAFARDVLLKRKNESAQLSLELP